MNKNNLLLLDFIAYCQANPDQRFWQALANWSGYNCIGQAETPNGDNFQDLWHKEGK